MNRLVILLRIIVISRGYILLNEQFLVRICFVRFVGRVILYSGDDIKTGLETKRNELLQDENDYIEKKKRLKDKLLNILKNRIGISSNLTILNQTILNRREEGFKNQLLQEKNNFEEIIRNELQIVYQFEQLLIPRIQNEILNNMNIVINGNDFISIRRKLIKRAYFNIDEGFSDIDDTDKSFEEYKKREEDLTEESIRILVNNYIEDNLIEEIEIEDQFLTREFE